MWETTVMHKQVSGWTVNFGPNFPESPFLELKTRKPPLHFRKLQIWDDQSLLRNTPPFRKASDLGIWDDQSLLQNTPPPTISENFRFGMTKVYSGVVIGKTLPSRKPSPLQECKIFGCRYLIRRGVHRKMVITTVYLSVRCMSLT